MGEPNDRHRDGVETLEGMEGAGERQPTIQQRQTVELIRDSKAMDRNPSTGTRQAPVREEYGKGKLGGCPNVRAAQDRIRAWH